MTRLLNTLVAVVGLLLPSVALADCSYDKWNKITTCNATLDIPKADEGVMILRRREAPAIETVTRADCRAAKAGFPVARKQEPSKWLCASFLPLAIESYAPNGKPVWSEQNCEGTTLYASDLLLERAQDIVKDGWPPQTKVCQVALIGPDPITPALPPSMSSARQEPPREALQAVPQRVVPSPAPAADPGFMPQAAPAKMFIPQAAPAMPVPKAAVSALPAPLVNTLKPPQIVMKAQKQPISQACAAVASSKRISSICDFKSGVDMYANDLRIPAQYAQECPSPLDVDYVDPQTGAWTWEVLTPRRTIVYSCGAPITQLRVR